ncbi:VOC family protein [Rhodoferax sp. BAB1]|uniref:VOC family protein n=1 Tax=Rhodoferax sp. BAB1 TaxID=2741720 RepID=UPI0015754B7D|nr:VOC family protein [Rhodoferax sp. BAB1]QKO21136.1 VOC family protein [Rhodoferax sp. BAB1]
MTHASSRVAALRSVALTVPDLAQAEAFYTGTWNLSVAARTSDALYLRGTGADHHLLALHQAPGPARIRNVTLRARNRAALDEVAQAVNAAGGRVLESVGPVQEPGGGTAVTVADADGRIFRLVHGDALHTDAREEKDRPLRLAHTVLNSHDVEATRAFMEQVFDFSLSDRTRIMAFMRCNSDHHSIALGDTDNDALNHIAFLMPDLESVMRGGGRMRDAGYGIEWGPGRHGPGDNAFNYFVGPFDVVIEYTAEVEQVDDSYQARQPSDWTWPPGRVDQWGISLPPSARLKQAQKAIVFVS